MPKPNDPTNPDNAPNPPTFPARSKDMDSTLPPGADAEERFNEFWKQNGTSIFVSIAIAAVVVLGVQTWRYMQQRAEMATRAEYAAAAGSHEQLAGFASDNAGHPLAGVAYMDMANAEFQRGEFQQAGEHYRMAREELKGNPLSVRAQMGEAMSALLGTNPDQGVAALRSIVDNVDNLQSTRAEAAYNLAMHYWQKKDWQSLKDIVTLAESFEDGGIYTYQTRLLRDQIPEIQ